MNDTEINWMYVIAIVVLALTTILAMFDKISAEDAMKIFLLVIGACITGAVAYTAGKYKGWKEGKYGA